MSNRKKAFKKAAALALCASMIAGSLSMSDVIMADAGAFHDVSRGDSVVSGGDVSGNGLTDSSTLLKTVSGSNLYADRIGGDYTRFTENEVIAELKFGTDITSSTIYNETAKYGFSDVEYNTPAVGWKNNVYYPREISRQEPGAAYVEDGTGYLAIASKVWSEKESTGYGNYTYENTSTFDMDLANADYQVDVTFVNPTGSAYQAYIETEDITRQFAPEKEGDAYYTSFAVEPGKTVQKSFTAVVIDGCLNLKFVANSSASSESAAEIKKVYVSDVKITRLATEEKADKPTVYLASDSTVQTYDAPYFPPQTGWGQVLAQFFGESSYTEEKAADCTYWQSRRYVADNAIVENRAIGGRSSRSFVEEGKLDDLLEDIRVGDYLFIQWGHNDATYSRPNRYVDVSDFEEWIMHYIDGALQRGAQPVLVTPVARYSYQTNADGSLKSFKCDYEGYRGVMFDISEKYGIPLIDLSQRSIDVCNLYGIEGSKSLFLHVAKGEYPDSAYKDGKEDDTHLQQYGAYKFSKCVAEGILESDSPELADLKARVVVSVSENVPGKITNLENTDSSAGKIKLSWDKTDGAELYYVYRAELAEGEDPEAVDFTNAERFSVSSINQFTDTKVKPGTTYVYAVRGFNDKGLGEFSGHCVVTTKSFAYMFDFNYNSSPTMAGWTGVKQNQTYSADKGYGWIKAPNDGRHRSGNGNADSSDMADDFALGAGEFAVDVTNGDYEITLYSGDLLKGTGKMTANFTAEGTAVGSVVSQVSLGSLTAPVRVEDGQLNVAISGSCYFNGMTVSEVQLAPNGLVVSEMGTSDGVNMSFLLSFHTVKNAVSYQVYGRNTIEEEFSLIKEFSAEDWENKQLECSSMVGQVGETYQYYIVAELNDGGKTARSEILRADMFLQGNPAAAPENVHCTSPLPNETQLKEEISLAWSPVSGAVKYIVYRSDKSESDKAFKGYEKVGETRENAYTDSDGVQTNVHWYYKVAAVTATGIGAQSEECITPVTGSLVAVGKEKYTDRAVVAIHLAGGDGGEIQVSAADKDGNPLTKGVYLSWRSFEDDLDADNNLTTSFTVYRDGSVIASGLKGTNLVDEGGDAGSVYRVVGSNDGGLGLEVLDTKVWKDKYLELTLSAPEDEIMPNGSSCTYSANDMSLGDLDGDGQLELIVKWYPSNAQDNSKEGYTGKTFLDGYDVDFSTGAVKLLWRIDMGINIRSGAHYTQFQVWDFDGDGKSEIAVKTADGTTAYKSANGTAADLEKTGYVGACDTDALPVDRISENNDYRNSTGYVLSGPEYFTMFNGEDGTIIDTVDYIPERGKVSDWGDNYGGRVDRFLAAVAYLDGKTPFAVFARGYYTRTCLTAYYMKDTDGDGIGDSIDVYWKFDTNEAGKEYEGQGNHGLAVNDVDRDGMDEIIYGSLVIDHDGTVKYSTGLGHGDAMHVSDWVSWNDGLEIMSVHESAGAKYHVEIRDAETGKILMGYSVGRDNGRGVAADIDPTAEGAEFWSIGSAEISYDKNPAWNATNGEVYSTWSTLNRLVKLADSTPASNFSIFWDGDLLSEIQDHTFNEPDYVPVGVAISKWNYETQMQENLLYSEEIYSNNGTKGNMGMVADFLGDWREEIITRTSDDKNKVRIYSTSIQTDYVVPCLLEDLSYREAVAWQNVGYNQPANTTFLLSKGLVTAQLGKSEVSYDSASIVFSPANDGDLYGHEITGYEIYRSEGGGSYELLDTVQEADLDRTQQENRILYENDFEDGVTDFQAYVAGTDKVAKDGASSNANASGYVYSVAGVSNGGRAAISPELGAATDGVKVGMDFRLDAAGRSGQSSCVALLPEEPSKKTWIEASDQQILTIAGTAGSGSKFSSITINNEDVTAKLKGAKGEASELGKKGDTTGWIHMDAVVDFSKQRVDLVLTRISTGEVVYEGSVDFLTQGISELNYIYCVGGRDSGVTGIDNVKVDASVKAGNYVYTDHKVASNTEYSYKIAAIVDGRTSHMSRPLALRTAVHVKAVEEIAPVTLIEGTPLEDGKTVADLLPAAANVTDMEDRVQSALITWDVSQVDIGKVGQYTAVAHIEGYALPMNVQVNVVANEVKAVRPLELVIINMGEEPVLPATVTVEYTNTTTAEKEVVWNLKDADLTRHGEGEIEGTVEGYNGVVTVPVFVEYPLVKRFDFGISTGNVAEGWTGVTVNAKGKKKTASQLGINYTQDRGYGFLDANAKIEGRAESYSQAGVIPSKVYTDFALPAGNTFAVDVEAGFYEVEMISGSMYSSSIKAKIEGRDFDVSNGANAYVTGRMTVKVSDGQLTLEFPSDNVSRVDGVIVRRVTDDMSKVDKALLQTAVEDAEKIKAEDYTEASYNEMKKVLDAAREVLEDEAATQDKVDDALEALKDAVAGLEKPVDPPEPEEADKSGLQAAAADAEKLKAEDYTETSYNAMKKALDAAKAVLADEAATQDEVNSALKELRDAVAGLEKPVDPPEPEVVDKSGLQAAVDSAAALKEADYTAESYAALRMAMEAARKVLGDENATEEEVETALKAVEQTVAALTKAGDGGDDNGGGETGDGGDDNGGGQTGNSGGNDGDNDNGSNGGADQGSTESSGDGGTGVKSPSTYDHSVIAENGAHSSTSNSVLAWLTAAVSAAAIILAGLWIYRKKKEEKN